MMTDDTFDEFDDFDDGADPFEDVENAPPQMRTLEEFEAEVEYNMKIILSRKPGVERRVEAAYWLGDSGSPKAIQALRKVYAKEKDKKVKAAAAYALGQFKALDEAILRDEDESVMDALGKDENSWVVERLQEIALQKRRGKRLPIPVRTLAIIQGVLAVVFVVLLIANLALGGGDSGTPLAGGNNGRNNVPSSPLTSPARPTLNDIQARIPSLRADAEALQAQLDTVAAGEPLNCVTPFVRPEAITGDAALLAEYPALDTLITRYNEAQAQLISALGRFDNACQGDSVFISSSNRTEAENSVTQVLAIIPELETQIIAVEGEIDAVEVNLRATATAEALNAAATARALTMTEDPNAPTATPTPEPTATPGLTRVQLNRHIGEMYRILDEVEEANRTLDQYWTSIQDRNDTGGCRIVRPALPESYTLPPEDAAVEPRLQNAVDLVNVAVLLNGSGWDAFTLACDNGLATQPERVQTGLAATETVQNAIINSRAVLDDLSGQ